MRQKNFKDLKREWDKYIYIYLKSVSGIIYR